MTTRDMTAGEPWRILLTFSVPMLLSMALQQLYNIIDSVIIGKWNGDEAFAAVSASYPVTALFVAVAGGMSLGVSVVTSQLFGEKRLSQVRTCAYTSLISMTVLGVILSLIGMIGCRPLLTWMNTDAAVFEDAAAYLLIYSAGVLFMFWYNTANGIFTALGDSMTPLWLLISSTALNIVLDIVLVGPCRKGVAGAAWATLAAQGVSSSLALILLVRRIAGLGGTSADSRRFDRRLFARILRIAIPSVCQQSFVSIGQLFVQSSVNQFDVNIQVGYGGAFKINMFTVSCITTMSHSLSSFVAQNTGAQQWHRIRQGRAAAQRLTWIFTTAATVLVVVFSAPLMSMFTDDPDTVAIGQQFLWTVSPFYGMIAIKIIDDGVFRGVGAMKPFIAGTFLDLGIRVTASYLLPPVIGYCGIWWAFPLGWAAATVLAIVLYRFGNWTHAQEIRAKVVL